MSPRKLTEDDKKNMLKLYCNSAATTSTLAAEFGVSSSTVSRFLKNRLSTEEYEELIQQKRLARTTKGEKQKSPKKDKPSKKKSSATVIADIPTEVEVIDTKPVEVVVEEATEVSEKKVRRRRRSRTKVEEQPPVQEQELEKEEVTAEEVKPSAKASLKLKSELPPPQEELTATDEEDEDDDDDLDVVALSAMLGEDIGDDDDDDLEDEDDDENEDEDDYPHTNSQNSLEILPLASASLPRTCYLVVDRASELIVKPLQEFADLGAIPEAEILQKTLPVFDNHRVAKRFSHRREKVIKVPDGKMLQKTSHYLYDKGITRLLIRGQIYEINR